MKITDTSYGDQYYAANGQDRDRPALRWYTSILRRNSNTDLRALDFGCGAGFLTKRLSAHFKSVVAFDHSEHARATTAKNCPSAIVSSDLAQFTDSTFGSIIAIHVLEHIPSPIPTLLEMNRLLRQDGTLLVVVPDLNGRGHKIKGINWFGFRDPTHCTLKPHSEWMNDFTARGLPSTQARHRWPLGWTVWRLASSSRQQGLVRPRRSATGAHGATLHTCWHRRVVRCSIEKDLTRRIKHLRRRHDQRR